MGFWNHITAQFLDVVEWLDDSRDTLVYRFPVFNQAITDKSVLVVREGQAAVFVSEGQLSDVFGPGTYELDTRNAPISTFFDSIKYALDYPYKGDIYFVSTRQFTQQKWGTQKPFTTMDPQIGPVRVRAFGVYSYRITDPARMLTELVGTDGLFTTDEINGQLRDKLVSGLVSAIAQAKMPVLELASQYMNLGEALREQMSPWFEESYGLTLTDFTVSNISLPENVEAMLDKRSSMGLVGDLNAFTQFQAAQALEAAATNEGGGGIGAGLMNAGIGLAMGNVVGSQMTAAQGAAGVFNPQTAAPPPPPSQTSTLHYSGPGGQSQMTPAQIAEAVQASPDGNHHVWSPGWDGWKNWSDVPEVSSLVAPPPPPPPPV
jgi:membrane protease subunit (stomatin/prohibitin family)